MSNLEKARLWAETWSDTTVPANTRAAIDIIQSLPDQWVNAEKLREIIEGKEGRPPATALPEPKEDEVWIIEEEQGGRGVGRFAGKEDEFPWFILLDRGTYDNYKMGSVTPICRMVPETHALPEGMRLADHEEYGRVVVSPYTSDGGAHRAYKLTATNIYGAGLTVVHADDLDFLDGAQ